MAGGPCYAGAGGPAYDGPGGNAGVLSLTSAFGWGISMAKTLIVLGKAWLWAAAALTLLAYGYVWWTEGFWQMEKSGHAQLLECAGGLRSAGTGHPPIDRRETPPCQA